jgi:DNA repair protein SbcD/Mre11
MARKPLRLLHAANLRLDCPLQQFGTLPDDVRNTMDEAAFTAFDRLIGLAIERDVDALLLTGNSFDAAAGSLDADVSLRHGFERLDDRGIPVFVTPGMLDPVAAWNEFPPLPENVTILSSADDPAVDLTDHGHLLATLVAVHADSSIEPHELDNLFESRPSQPGERPFVVGLLLPHRGPLHGGSTAQFAALDWLACAAGETVATHLPLTDGVVNAQSGPQGLSPAEAGSRGATLLEVDGQRRVRQSFVPLAPVRWESLTQSLDRVNGRDDLLERMLTTVEKLPSYPGELVRVIDWTLDRTNGETHGWELASAVQELSAMVTELTDQPAGLRYVHRIRPLDSDLSNIEPAHRELLTEYLLALDRRTPVERPAMTKWLAEAHLGEALKTSRWEHWAESVEPAAVARRAQQLGWQWFASIGKK